MASKRLDLPRKEPFNMGPTIFLPLSGFTLEEGAGLAAQQSCLLVSVGFLLLLSSIRPTLKQGVRLFFTLVS